MRMKERIEIVDKGYLFSRKGPKLVHILGPLQNVIKKMANSAPRPHVSGCIVEKPIRNFQQQ